ncbi:MULTISPECIES: NADP-dependent oxidoreductase [unclassified Paludibacterium]|uniref:NADP-dependent oxidoreductase n=1 Tax=unclassified Paludibacterium TaxID=2618429 RepID=UPI001C05E331|nr:NADP-dependent oxidoreductase [Paludibacterium sp. B53371]BEV72329.1 NADP-dependent oxidoreductase [Paludibacterium sp. THUN1379]
MTHASLNNRRIVLASRPVGAPQAENFRLEDATLPALQEGELLVRQVYLSLDPYMRGRMSDAKSYAAPVAIDEVMVGGTVGQVLQSRDPDFAEGDWVLANGGWQELAVVAAGSVHKLGREVAEPSRYLGVLGMPGFTAYMGLLDIGQPKAGETVVVAAATGAVGSVVGQLAKRLGCRVVGIAGGDEKCRYAVEELGFDACIDHKAADLPGRLAAACPQGIDVYFENVGGAVFDAVLPLLNPAARVPLCGLISQYNATGLPQGEDRLSLLMGTLLRKRIRMQGFIIFDDYAHRYGEFLEAMLPLVNSGAIKLREDRVEGLEKAPEALMGLLQGKNFGKLVVRLA